MSNSQAFISNAQLFRLFIGLLLVVQGGFAIRNKIFRMGRRGNIVYRGKPAQVIGIGVIIAAVVLNSSFILTVMNVSHDVEIVNFFSIGVTIVGLFCWILFVRIIEIAVNYGRYIGSVNKIPISQDEPSGWGIRKRKEKLDEPNEL